jgi:subtilisin family serine protease
LLVAFAGGTGSAVAEAIAAANGLTVVESAGLDLIDRQIHRLRINDGRTVEEVAAVLSADQRVLSARPNTIFTGQARPAPSRAGLQYAVTRLGLAEAHASARGRGVTVAVIDTGVDAGHEALRTARIRSISVMAEKPLAQDHGTEIAGALAAAGGALTGVAPDADIVAIEAFGVSRDGVAEATAFHLVEALDRAWMERARVINMSFAGGEEPLITEMLDALAVRDVVLVAAAGNEGPKAPPAHPGAHPRVIAVTATDASDGRFAMANRGGYILLAAPGVDILAPAAGGKVRLTSGTSIATAHVSGAIALLLERRPELSAAEIRAILAATARDLGARGADAEYGAGLVDPVAALKAGLPRGLQADAVR